MCMCFFLSYTAHPIKCNHQGPTYVVALSKVHYKQEQYIWECTKGGVHVREIEMMLELL